MTAQTQLQNMDKGCEETLWQGKKLYNLRKISEEVVT